MEFFTGSAGRWFDLAGQPCFDARAISEKERQIQFFGAVNKTL
jgi:hypothetical protein